MVTEYAIENNVVSESVIEEMAFKQTLECNGGWDIDFGRKNKLDPENSKCDIRRYLQKSQRDFIKDCTCIANFINVVKI